MTKTVDIFPTESLRLVNAKKQVVNSDIQTL